VSLVDAPLSSRTIFEIVGGHDTGTFPVTVKVSLATYVRSCLESKIANKKCESHLEIRKTRLDDRVVIDCSNNIEIFDFKGIPLDLFNGYLRSAAEFVLTWSDVDGILIKEESFLLRVFGVVAPLFSKMAAEFRSEGDYHSQSLFQSICDDFIRFLTDINN
jgi:hypothetical protein